MGGLSLLPCALGTDFTQGAWAGLCHLGDFRAARPLTLMCQNVRERTSPLLTHISDEVTPLSTAGTGTPTAGHGSPALGCVLVTHNRRTHAIQRGLGGLLVARWPEKRGTPFWMQVGLGTAGSRPHPPLGPCVAQVPFSATCPAPGAALQPALARWQGRSEQGEGTLAGWHW